VDVAATALAAGPTTTLGAKLPAARRVADINGTIRTGSTTLVTAAELSGTASLDAEDGEGDNGEGLGKVHDELNRVEPERVY
jgi:hypothetical protein